MASMHRDCKYPQARLTLERHLPLEHLPHDDREAVVGVMGVIVMIVMIEVVVMVMIEVMVIEVMMVIVMVMVL